MLLFYWLGLLLAVATAGIAVLLLVVDQRTVLNVTRRTYCSYYGHRWRIASGTFDTCVRCGERKHLKVGETETS